MQVNNNVKRCTLALSMAQKDQQMIADCQAQRTLPVLMTHALQGMALVPVPEAGHRADEAVATSKGYKEESFSSRDHISEAADCPCWPYSMKLLAALHNSIACSLLPYSRL